MEEVGHKEMMRGVSNDRCWCTEMYAFTENDEAASLHLFIMYNSQKTIYNGNSIALIKSRLLLHHGFLISFAVVRPWPTNRIPQQIIHQ